LRALYRRAGALTGPRVRVLTSAALPRSTDMIAFALYMPRLAYTDLSGPEVYLSGVMANTHH